MVRCEQEYVPIRFVSFFSEYRSMFISAIRTNIMIIILLLFLYPSIKFNFKCITGHSNLNKRQSINNVWYPWVRLPSKLKNYLCQHKFIISESITKEWCQKLNFNNTNSNNPMQLKFKTDRNNVLKKDSYMRWIVKNIKRLKYH